MVLKEHLAVTVTVALCVIFTILVSFSQDNALLASKVKSKLFEIFSNGAAPMGPEE